MRLFDPRLMTFSVPLVLLWIALWGCDAFEKKNQSKEDGIFNVDQLPSDCQINPQELAKFATTNIEPQIRCLENKLLQFSRYVGLVDPEQINAEELTKFINKFFPEQKEKILPPMGILFSINHLLFEDRPNIISVGQIPELAELLIIINRELSTINQVAPEKLLSNREEQRQIFAKSLAVQMQELSRLSIGKKQQNTTLNVMEFLQYFLQAMQIQVNVEPFRHLLFLKKLFLGGEPGNITTEQMHLLFAKIPSLAELVFDLLYRPGLSSNSLKGEQGLADWPLWWQHLRTLQAQIKLDIPPEEVLFSTKLLGTLGEQLYPQANWQLLAPLFNLVKEKLFTGSADQCTMGDLQLILGQLTDLSESLAFSQITYRQIEKPQQIPTIQDLIFANLPEYQHFPSDKVDIYWQNFMHFLTHYRYFLNPQHQLYYGTDYRPELYGLEVAQLGHWLVGKLLRAYGMPRQNNGKIEESKYVFTTKQLENALKAFRPLLEHLHFWPEFFNSFALNTSILVDLFQNQSDGDNLLNQDELTEYLLMIISTVRTQQLLEKELPKYCQPLPCTQIYVETICHRKNILPILMQKINWQYQLPQLGHYFYRAQFGEIQQLMKSLEDFTRDAQTEQDPISPRNRTLLIGALMNIESLFLRFDRNLDNVLDFDELSQAYLLFNNLLMAYLTEFFGLDPDLAKTYSKSIFFFLVDRRYPPGKYELLWFHHTTNLKKIQAHRINIGAILSYFAKTNAEQNKRQKKRTLERGENEHRHCDGPVSSNPSRRQ